MKFGAVIVNYNCAAYALSAALSVLGDKGDACVVIVDNHSTDNSLDYFERVFAGETEHQTEAPNNASPPCGFSSVMALSPMIADEGNAIDSASRLVVVRAKKNGGFAAGCNIGLRHLRALHDPAIYLLLNPDALLARGSLAAFAERLSAQGAGLCGASVLRHETPTIAQAFGGAALHPLTLLGANIGADRHVKTAPTKPDVEATLSYPLGAAMAFRKEYLDIAGFLDERFFLYYEEADWVRRAYPRLKPVWAPGAVVYHRHGAAAGSRLKSGTRSPLADYHMVRSRLLYALKWRPLLTPLLMASGVVQAMRRLLRGQWKQARAVLLGSIPLSPKNFAP